MSLRGQREADLLKEQRPDLKAHPQGAAARVRRSVQVIGLWEVEMEMRRGARLEGIGIGAGRLEHGHDGRGAKEGFFETDVL